MDPAQFARDIAAELIRKSGVQEWNDEAVQIAVADAAVDITTRIYTGLSEWLEAMATSKNLVAEMDGTPKQISFADHAGDFSPANSLEFGTPTDCQLSMASVATGAARQSAKVDLGAVRALLYAVRASFEFAATPTAGHVVSLYWNNSSNSTAANGNMGNASGSDAAYAGYSSNLAATLPQLQFIGDFVMTAQATGTIQYGSVGTFMPRERYGSLIVVNHLAGSGAAFHSDDVECNVVFDPIVPQGQAA